MYKISFSDHAHCFGTGCPVQSSVFSSSGPEKGDPFKAQKRRLPGLYTLANTFRGPWIEGPDWTPNESPMKALYFHHGRETPVCVPSPCSPGNEGFRKGLHLDNLQ